MISLLLLSILFYITFNNLIFVLKKDENYNEKVLLFLSVMSVPIYALMYYVFIAISITETFEFWHIIVLNLYLLIENNFTDVELYIHNMKITITDILKVISVTAICIVLYIGYSYNLILNMSILLLILFVNYKIFDKISKM